MIHRTSTPTRVRYVNTQGFSGRSINTIPAGYLAFWPASAISGVADGAVIPASPGIPDISGNGLNLNHKLQVISPGPTYQATGGYIGGPFVGIGGTRYGCLMDSRFNLTNGGGITLFQSFKAEGIGGTLNYQVGDFESIPSCGIYGGGVQIPSQTTINAFLRDDSGSFIEIVGTGTNANDGLWHTVALTIGTYGTNAAKIYVNGAFVAQGNWTGLMTFSNSTLYCFPNYETKSDWLLFYPRELSASEVNVLHNLASYTV